MTEEANFQNKVIKYLKKMGIYHVKYWGGGIYTKAGVPDILACVNGYFMGIELKATKGKVSELQYWNRDEIRKSGGVSIILYPDQFEDFKKFINILLDEPKTSNHDDQNKFDKNR